MVVVLMVVPAVAQFGLFDQSRTPIRVGGVFFGLGLQRTHLFAMGIALRLWLRRSRRSRRSRRRLTSWHAVVLVAACIVVADLHVFPFHRAMAHDPARRPSTIGFAVLLLVIRLAARVPTGGCRASRGSPRRSPGSRGSRMVSTWCTGNWATSWRAPCWTSVSRPGWAITARVERPLHRRLTAAVGRRAAKAGPEADRDPEKPRSKAWSPFLSVARPSMDAAARAGTFHRAGLRADIDVKGRGRG